MEADESHPCKKSRAGASGNVSGGAWNNPASRIYRVSRASGGKDRHSKVYTSKGLRDRRVRLSGSAAIHLYDLQDRLGFDQPSKAIEWLIKAAAGAIAELPALESSFPDSPKEMNFVLEMEAEDDGRKFNWTNSGSSSTSETTKASVLSISQSEICLKARQRAAEEKDQDGGINQRIDSRSSFTELLNGNSGGGNCDCGIVTVAETESRKQNCYLQGTATPDCFAQGGAFSQLQKSNQSSSCAGITALGSSRFRMNMVTFNTGAAAVAMQRSDHSEMQHFLFMQDHPVPRAAVAAGDDFNLNFSLSPDLAGFNRETLQSNSSESQLHHHRHNHLSYPIDGSKIPFFGATSPAAAAGASQSQSQLLGRFDGGLQLYYGEGCRHSDLNC